MVAIAAISLVALVPAACSSGDGATSDGAGAPGAATSVPRVGADGVTRIPGEDLKTQLDAIPRADLTAEEEAGLLRMREEEKLAHDVYVALGQSWGTKAFTNIAAAEQTHADAVGTLLDRYEIADPSEGKGAGSFTDPAIQDLYASLVEQGSGSLVDALTVGATIEDLDIADLQARATDTADIALVYANLEKGSRNHLRAFTKQLDRNGASYTPTHITQAEYDAIVSSDMERGSGG
jgi:hypothetical protein